MRWRPVRVCWVEDGQDGGGPVARSVQDSDRAAVRGSIAMTGGLLGACATSVLLLWSDLGGGPSGEVALGALLAALPVISVAAVVIGLRLSAKRSARPVFTDWLPWGVLIALAASAVAAASVFVFAETILAGVGLITWGLLSVKGVRASEPANRRWFALGTAVTPALVLLATAFTGKAGPWSPHGADLVSAGSAFGFFTFAAVMAALAVPHVKPDQAPSEV